MPKMIERLLLEKLKAHMRVMPAVLINGPRQAGKTTLAKMAAEKTGAAYVSFDDPSALAFAKSGPVDFLERFKGPCVLDEIQRVPELFLPLKKKVDELRFARGGRADGRFILTGSASLASFSALADAMVGRMGILSLLPLSAAEISGQPGFLEKIFKGGFEKTGLPGVETAKMMRRATFPGLSAHAAKPQREWFEGYIETLFSRDLRFVSDVENYSGLSRLLKLAAARAGTLLNDAAWARETALPMMTLRRYREVLARLFLLTVVPPWFANLGKRVVKAPKIYISDTALLCHLLNAEPGLLRESQPQLFGHVLENFVACELRRQLAFGPDAQLFHFRTHENDEVDFVLEAPGGRIAGLEVKASSTVQPADFKGLRLLRDATKGIFANGVVLYQGRQAVAVENNLWAVPVSALWQTP